MPFHLLLPIIPPSPNHRRLYKPPLRLRHADLSTSLVLVLLLPSHLWPAQRDVFHFDNTAEDLRAHFFPTSHSFRYLAFFLFVYANEIS